MVAVAYLVPVLMVMSGMIGFPALLPLLSVPLVVPLVRIVFAHGDPRRLNQVLQSTARVGLVFASLFAVGLAVVGTAGLS